jgi:hypothetical protein
MKIDDFQTTPWRERSIEMTREMRKKLNGNSSKKIFEIEQGRNT